MSVLASSAATLTISPGGKDKLLEIVDSDYSTPVTTVYGRGGVVYVKLTDSSKNVLPEPEVVRLSSVKSHSTASGEPVLDDFSEAPSATLADQRHVDLLETGPSTGVFVGSFRVRDTASDAAGEACDLTAPYAQGRHAKFEFIFGDACLQVADGGKIDVSAGTGTDLQKSVRWRIPSAGGLAANLPVTSPISGYASSIQFTITDADLNRNANAVETYEGLPSATNDRAAVLRVFSDSDLGGELIRVVEDDGVAGSGDGDKNVPTFRGTVKFESSHSATNGAVFVKHGDRVQAVYVEANDAGGQRKEHLAPQPAAGGSVDFWIFHASSDSTLTLGRDRYFGQDPDGDGIYAPPMVVTLDELEAGVGSGLAQTVKVQVAAAGPNAPPPADGLVGSGGGFKEVTLSEVGGLSGLFVGDVFFVTPERADTQPERDSLDKPVREGGTGGNWIAVSHADKIFVNFDDAQNLAGVPVLHRKTSEFFIFQTAKVILGPSESTTVLVGTLNLQNVRVEDFDANRNPLSADIVQARIKSSSDSVGILVTLLEDGSNSGIFVGQFMFTKGASGGISLKVQDRDLVRVEYADQRLADEESGRVLSTNQVVWRDSTDGTIAFDQPYYVKRSNAPGTPVSFAERADVTIEDKDQNNPVIVDQIPVQITRAIIDIVPNQGLIVKEPDDTDPANFLPAVINEFKVSLSRPPLANVQISFESTDMGEVCITSPSPSTPCGRATLTFTPANYNLAQAVVIVPVEDDIVDGDKNVKIRTLAAVSTDPIFNGLDPTDILVRTIDRDGAGIVVSKNGVFAAPSVPGGTAARASAIGVLTGEPTTVVTPDTSLPPTGTGPGANIEQIPNTDVFDVVLKSKPTAPVHIPMSIILPVQPDTEIPMSFAEACFDDIDASVAIASSINPDSCIEATLVFDATNWNQVQHVTVVGLEDQDGSGGDIPVLPDGTMDYRIQLGASSSTDPNYNNVDATDILARNFDTDRALVVFDRSTLITDEYGTEARLGVRLSKQPAAPGATVSVTLIALQEEPGSPTFGQLQAEWKDGQRTGEQGTPVVLDEQSRITLTFDGTDWDDRKFVDAIGIDDAVNEPVPGNNQPKDPTSTAVYYELTSTDPEYQALGAAQAARNAQPDPSDLDAGRPLPEVPVIILTWDNEGEFDFTRTSGVMTTTANGGSAFFMARLMTTPTEPVTLRFTLSPSGEACLYDPIVNPTWNTAVSCPSTVQFTFTPDSPSLLYGEDLSSTRKYRPFVVVGKDSGAAQTQPYDVLVSVISTDERYDFTAGNPPVADFIVPQDIHFSNFYNRPYPGAGAPLMARETGADTGVFRLSLPTGFGGTDAAGVPLFDPGPHGASFFAEYIDPAAANGFQRTILTTRGAWHEGPDASIGRFETLDGRRITQVYMPADIPADSGYDVGIQYSVYGDTGGTLRPLRNGDNNAFRADHRSDDCSGTLAPFSVERFNAGRTSDTYRWSAPLILTRTTGDTGPADAPSTNNCDNDGSAVLIAPLFDDNILTVNAEDSVRFADNFGVVGMESLTVKLLQPELMSIVNATGLGANLDNFGTQSGNFVRLSGGPWNVNAGGRDVAVIDAAQLSGAVPNMAASEVTLVETQADSGEFLGSLGFGPRRQLDIGTFATATTPDVSPTPLLLGNVTKGRPAFVVCFGGDTVADTAGVQNLPAYAYLRLGTCDGNIAAGDVRLTSVPTSALVGVGPLAPDTPLNPATGEPITYAPGTTVQPRDFDTRAAATPYSARGIFGPPPQYAYFDRAPVGFGSNDILYIDADRSGTISVLDIRLRNWFQEAGLEHSREATAYTIVYPDEPDCPAGGGAVNNVVVGTFVQCSNRNRLVPLAIGVPTASRPLRGTYVVVGTESFLDLNGNGLYDYHDAVYLDIENRNLPDPDGAGPLPDPADEGNRTSALDFRLTGALNTNSLLPVQTPASLGSNSRALEAAWLSLQPAWWGSTNTGGTYWYPAQDAAFVLQTGVGTSSSLHARIADDAAAGYVIREKITADGLDEIQLSERAAPDFTIAQITRREPMRTAQPSDESGERVYIVDAAGAGSAEPIVDRDHDGDITCGPADTDDAKVLVTGDIGTCVSTLADLRAGRIVVDCDGPCQVDVLYMYRAIRVASAPADAFQYRVDGDKLVFGADIPNRMETRVTFRRESVLLLATSTNTGETERFRATIPAIEKDYNVFVPVELLGTANNQFLHVKTGAQPYDRIKLVYGDNLRADGLPGSGLEADIRSTVGFGQWVQAVNGQMTFWTPDFQAQASGTALGPSVALQILDADRDVTNQRDSFVVTARRGGDTVNDVAPVVMREVEASGGVFRGTIPVELNHDGINQGDRIDVPVIPGTDNIFVEWLDPVGADARPVLLSASVVWRPTVDGQIRITDCPIVGPGCPTAFPITNGNTLLPGRTTDFEMRGAASPLYIAVSDPDANLNAGAVDKAFVIITTPTDPSGELIQLLETGTSTGVFTSPAVTFETERNPGNDKVYALDLARTGEMLRIRYIDFANAAGIPQSFEPTPDVKWHRTFDGAVRFDRGQYVGLSGDPASGSVQFANIYVEDGDLNKDPRVVDITTTVKVAFGQVTTAGGDADKILDASKAEARLFETGANTGIFMARVSFDTTATTPAAEDPKSFTSAVARAAVGTGTSAPIRAFFLDDRATDAGGDSRGVNVGFGASAEWQRRGVGLVVLDKAGYNLRSQVPQITLIDADLNANANVVEKPKVLVKSLTAHTAGFQVELTETSADSGIFRGTFGLQGPAGTDANKLKVADFDTIEVLYRDASPSADRTGRALVRIDDFLAPVTSLVTVPATPDGIARPGGLRVFKTDPQVSFVANEPVQQTFFKTSDSGAEQVYGGPFLLAATYGEGIYDMVVYSIDAAGVRETAKILSVGVDLTDPSQRVASLVGKPAPNGTVALSWPAVPVTGDPLEFYDYVVFRDDELVVPVGNSTTTGYVDASLKDELPHSYRVAVRDQSGRIGALSAAVSVIPDATRPRIFDPVATPPGFDNRSKPASVGLSVSASDLNLESVKASLVTPNGEVLTNVTLSPAGGGVFTGSLNTTNVTQACTCTLNLTASDVAGNTETLSLLYVVTGPDVALPEIRVTGVSDIGEVVRGQSVGVKVTDNVGLLLVQYRLNGGDLVTVPITPSGANTVEFTIPTATMAFGLYNLEVFAYDTAVNLTGVPIPNRGNLSVSFHLVRQAIGVPQLPPPETLPNFLLPTTATRLPNGDIRVEWTIDTSNLTVAPVGFQVWRASSPYTLHGNVSDANERSYVDNTTQPGKSYRYVTTYYTVLTGRFASLSEVPGYPGSDEQVAGSGPVTAREAGTPTWVWVILMVFAILAVSILVAVAIAARRNSRSQQQVLVEPETETAPAGAAPGAEGDQWTQPAAVEGGEQTHRLRCPECEHRFEVVGVKPIVTNCPNCGRKGILR